MPTTIALGNTAQNPQERKKNENILSEIQDGRRLEATQRNCSSRMLGLKTKKKKAMELESPIPAATGLLFARFHSFQALSARPELFLQQLGENFNPGQAAAASCVLQLVQEQGVGLSASPSVSLLNPARSLCCRSLLLFLKPEAGTYAQRSPSPQLLLK